MHRHLPREEGSPLARGGGGGGGGGWGAQSATVADATPSLLQLFTTGASRQPGGRHVQPDEQSEEERSGASFNQHRQRYLRTPTPVPYDGELARSPHMEDTAESGITWGPRLRAPVFVAGELTEYMARSRAAPPPPSPTLRDVEGGGYRSHFPYGPDRVWRFPRSDSGDGSRTPGRADRSGRSSDNAYSDGDSDDSVDVLRWAAGRGRRGRAGGGGGEGGLSHVSPLPQPDGDVSTSVRRDTFGTVGSAATVGGGAVGLDVEVFPQLEGPVVVVAGEDDLTEPREGPGVG